MDLISGVAVSICECVVSFLRGLLGFFGGINDRWGELDRKELEDYYSNDEVLRLVIWEEEQARREQAASCNQRRIKADEDE